MSSTLKHSLMRDGAFLVELLNRATAEPLLYPRCRAVEQLLAELALSRESDRVEPFNVLLRPHTVTAQLLGWKDGVPVFEDMPTLPESDLMLLVVKLARARLISRVKKCACGRWFFNRGEFCKRSCWKTNYLAKPKVQQENAKYQMRYFRENLSKYQKLYKRGMTAEQVRMHRKKLKLKPRRRRGS